MRDFFRSKNNNDLFEMLAVKRRIAFKVVAPDGTELRLRGDALREFLWLIRSDTAAARVEAWLDIHKMGDKPGQTEEVVNG